MHIQLQEGNPLTREEQKEQRRQQILLAGLNLFIKKGYTATQIADIAEAASMSTGLLFHYFESKEHLYATLVRIGLEGTKAPMALDTSEPITFFTEFVKGLFHYAKEQPMTAKMFVLMRQAQGHGDVPESVKEIAISVDTIEQSIAIIKAGQENKTIKTGNPAALSCAFWYSIQGIMEQYAQDETMLLPEVDWLVDILRNREGNKND